VKISKKHFSFFPSLNQYFPHIPYVASKNEFRAKKKILSVTRHRRLNSYIFEISATLYHLSWIYAPHTQNFEILKSLEQTKEKKKLKSVLKFL
jgi:hypothetical protein